MSGFDKNAEPLIQGDEMRSEEDEWEMAVEKIVVAKSDETRASQAQPGILVHHRSSHGPYKEESSWWTRMKSRRSPVSKV